MKVLWDGTYGFSSLAEKREDKKVIPFTDVITEAALSSQLFEDPRPECLSGRGLNSRPPAQQIGALPTELTRPLKFEVQINTASVQWVTSHCYLKCQEIINFLIWALPQQWND